MDLDGPNPKSFLELDERDLDEGYLTTHVPFVSHSEVVKFVPHIPQSTLQNDAFDANKATKKQFGSSFALRSRGCSAGDLRDDLGDRCLGNFQPAEQPVALAELSAEGEEST